MTARGDRELPSLYRQIADDLKEAIGSGTYAAGARLPSESDLAARYGASRGTIRQAFAALRTDGVISSRQGARRVVLGGTRLQSFADLLSFSRWARTIGERPSGRVEQLVHRPATAEEAAQLDLSADAQVWHLTRVRMLDGRPVMIERTAYPEHVGVLVADLDLDRESITERLAELGVVFSDAEHTIDAVAATAGNAGLLGSRRGTPLLRERRRTTDPAGVPLEWSEDLYLGNEVAFTMRNSASRNTLSRLHSTPEVD